MTAHGVVADENPPSPIPAAGNCHIGGQGTPLLLLHGLSGTWEIWKPLLPALEARHHVIVPTLPGHRGGPAYSGSGDASVAGLADQLIALMSAQGIERAHVAGNSLGGWLSLELARRGFALSVTALSPAGGWRTQKDYRAVARPFRMIHALMPLLIVLTTLFLRFAGVRRWLNQQTMEHGDRLSAEELREGMRGVAGTEVLPGLLRAMGKQGPIQPLQAGGLPIRIAWGDCDKVIPFETYGKPMLEAVQGAEYLSVQGVGHVPMYDDPGQIAAIILATMARAESATA